MTDLHADPDRLITTPATSPIITLSRWCVWGALFFSPWIIQWTLPIVGLNASAVPVVANVPKLRPADMLAALSIVLYASCGWPGLRRLWQRQRVWLGAMLGLALMTVLSILWAGQAALAIVFAGHTLLWILFMLRIACDDLEPGSIALSLFAGLLVNSAVGLAQFALQRSVGLTLFGELQLGLTVAGASVIGTDNLHLLRLYGLSGHPNVIGGFAAVALVWGLSLMARSARRWLPVILVAWLIGWLTLLLSFSRSAWLGIAVALGLIAVLTFRQLVYRHYAGRILAVVGMIVASIALLTIRFRPFIVERLTTPQSSTLETTSLDDRIDLMHAAFELIALRPLTGVGIGNFIASSQTFIGTAAEFDWVHNVPLLITSELGVPGLALWLIGLAAIWNGFRRSYRHG
ncbi:MAG TPA: O-antigen ligase family protein, partial [Anaerolineae bacterium]|nr:O-antigen ligase family protein [Anaerolineae bacterium]